MAANRVRTFVAGLDEDILNGGIPEGHVVLVRGASGTMKSSLVYYVLFHNALQGVPGLYVTLEQSAAGLLEHASHMGLRTSEVSEELPILDLSLGRDTLLESAQRMADVSGGKVDADGLVAAVLQGKIRDLRRRRPFSLLAIDSWAGMEALFPPKDRRAQVFSFFEWLRALDQTTFIVSDSIPRDPAAGAAEEEVLADGIFRLSMTAITKTEYQRRIQCMKMRCVKHVEDDRTLLFEDGRFEVARPIG